MFIVGHARLDSREDKTSGRQVPECIPGPPGNTIQRPPLRPIEGLCPQASAETVRGVIVMQIGILISGRRH